MKNRVREKGAHMGLKFGLKRIFLVLGIIISIAISTYAGFIAWRSFTGTKIIYPTDQEINDFFREGPERSYVWVELVIQSEKNSTLLPNALDRNVDPQDRASYYLSLPLELPSERMNYQLAYLKKYGGKLKTSSDLSSEFLTVLFLSKQAQLSPMFVEENLELVYHQVGQDVLARELIVAQFPMKLIPFLIGIAIAAASFLFCYYVVPFVIIRVAKLIAWIVKGFMIE